MFAGRLHSPISHEASEPSPRKGDAILLLQAMVTAEPALLTEILGRGGFEADEADLAAIARLMLAAHVSTGEAPQASSFAAVPPACLPACPPTRLPASAAVRTAPLDTLAPAPNPWQVSMKLGLGQLCSAVGGLHAIQRPLFQSAASLERQLAALRQRCGGSDSSGAGRKLPTVEQLQAAWAVLATGLGPWGTREGLLQAELAAFSEHAASSLLALQPDNPRSSFAMGEAVANNAVVNNSDSASRLLDPLPHLRHSAELARAQGSDFWLARWAGCRGAGAITSRRAFWFPQQQFVGGVSSMLMC